jgi:transposase
MGRVAQSLAPIRTSRSTRIICSAHCARYRWVGSPGAKYVGVVQSSIFTCRLQGIDPYTYLIDVLQQISEHPASGEAEAAPV